MAERYLLCFRCQASDAAASHLARGDGFRTAICCGFELHTEKQDCCEFGGFYNIQEVLCKDFLHGLDGPFFHTWVSTGLTASLDCAKYSLSRHAIMLRVEVGGRTFVLGRSS